MFTILKKNRFWYFLILFCHFNLSIYICIYNLKYDHPIKILALHMELTRDGKETVLIWVPGHVGIIENSAADSAAKDALDGDISDELISFSG